MSRLVGIVAASALVGCLVIERVLSEHLSQLLITRVGHECSVNKSGYPDIIHPCQADFDGDGTWASFVVSEKGDALEIFEGSRRILRIPFVDADNTYRTHIAIRQDNPPRLLTYDGINSRGSPGKVYFIRDGELVASPMVDDPKDEMILKAMAVRDDSGSMLRWGFFRLLRWPGLVVINTIIFVMIVRRPKLEAGPS